MVKRLVILALQFEALFEELFILDFETTLNLILEYSLNIVLGFASKTDVEELLGAIVRGDQDKIVVR